MSSPSRWPLPKDGVRFVSPEFLSELLQRHPLTKDCYPLAMGFYPNAVGHTMQRDVHDDHLIIYCVDGGGYVESRDYTGAVTAGDVVLLPKGCPHTYRANIDAPWSLYWCHFRGCCSHEFVHHISTQALSARIPVGHSSVLLGNFRAILAARKTGYNSTAMIQVANQLRQLLSSIPIEADNFSRQHHHNFNLDNLQAYMWENISRHLDLDALAARANLSKYHFCSKYKAITGYSPIKHFIHMKMEHACALLDTSDLSVGMIAAELGYDDPLYFTRTFKKTLGLSPRDYRLHT